MKDPEGWGYYSRFEQGFFQTPTLSRGGGGGGSGFLLTHALHVCLPLYLLVQCMLTNFITF